jgi:hypothetical protein
MGDGYHVTETRNITSVTRKAAMRFPYTICRRFGHTYRESEHPPIISQQQHTIWQTGARKRMAYSIMNKRLSLVRTTYLHSLSQ